MIIKVIETKNKGEDFLGTKYFILKPHYDEEDFFRLMGDLVERFEHQTKSAWYWCQDVYGMYHVSPCYRTEYDTFGWDLRIEFPWDRGD